MISKLKHRPRPDTHQNEKRTESGNLGRYVYLLMLAALALGMINFLWGDRVFLRADGLVLRDGHMLSVTSISRVETVAVRPGQSVVEGELLYQAASHEMLTNLTDNSLRVSELSGRVAALRARLKMVEALLPFASEQQARATEHAQAVTALADRGTVPVRQIDEATTLVYAARRETALLTSEQQSLMDEIIELTSAIQEVSRAKIALENHYGNGMVRAPISGTVGDQVPSVGQVFLPGAPVAEIISGEPYILTYLPRDYVFPIVIGMEVSIALGRIDAQGVVEEILPVSQSVPTEFRNVFRPEPTRQLARIQITDPIAFPTFANVRITRSLAKPLLAQLGSLFPM